jgi:hypothetical protein
MGSSFEDLIATSPTVKTDSKSDKRFDLQNFLNIWILHLMHLASTVLVVLACMHRVVEFASN